MRKNEIFNRELSWVQFNRRVLEEAANPDNPLLERGKFLSICASNLDEFFMVRVGSLTRKAQVNPKKEDPAGMTPQQQLDAIFPAVRELVDRQYALLNEEYLPALAQAGIHLRAPVELTSEQRHWLSNYFDAQIQPLLTPRAIDDKRPFPLLSARKIHLALLLPPDVRGGAPRMALLQLPSSLPRVILLPMGESKACGVMLEDVIAVFAGRMFGGALPIAVLPFRITRNTDFVYDDTDADALINEMRKKFEKAQVGSCGASGSYSRRG